MATDVRWIQRLNNFEMAMKSLLEDIETATSRQLNKLEKQGIIQAFEFNYELAWNTVKDFYEAQGETNIQGSRDAFMLAFNRGLVKNYGTVLIESIKARQMTSHTYNEETAKEIFDGIVNNYYDAFKELLDNLLREKNKTNNTK
jgi:nucleotidyltransferase substrate binding protein (TIGR01987 family)